MVRIYLNKIIDILNKLNVSHYEYIFIRPRICWQGYNLMSELYSETNIDFLMNCLIKCVL